MAAENTKINTGPQQKRAGFEDKITLSLLIF
jgi:hypothetical protein